MIKAIHAGIPGWADEPEEQRSMLAKYKKYGDQVWHSFYFSRFFYSLIDHMVNNA